MARSLTGPTSRSIHVRGLMLAALSLVLVGCSNGYFRSNNGSISIANYNEEAERNEFHGFDLVDGEYLELRTAYGPIEVIAGSGPEFGVHARMRARARTTADAQAVLDGYRIELRREGDTLVVEMVGEKLEFIDGSRQVRIGATVEFVAEVPTSTPVVATSGSGSIKTRGRLGATRLETRYGNVHLDGASGDVVAKSGSGAVTAGDLDGSKVHLESGFGRVAAKNVTADEIVLRSSSGAIELISARAATIELETKYGGVAARDVAGALTAKSGSGKVDVSEFEGALVATSQYGGVTVQGVLSSLAATSSSGHVTVHAADGSAVLDSWKLDSKYGAVTLRAPADLACQFIGETTYGEVVCGFELLVPPGARSKKRFEGTIGGGGGLVKLTTGTGNVKLAVN